MFTIFASNSNGIFVIGLDRNGNEETSGNTFTKDEIMKLPLSVLEGWGSVWAVAYDERGDIELENILIK